MRWQRAVPSSFLCSYSFAFNLGPVLCLQQLRIVNSGLMGNTVFTGIGQISHKTAVMQKSNISQYLTKKTPLRYTTNWMTLKASCWVKNNLRRLHSAYMTFYRRRNCGEERSVASLGWGWGGCDRQRESTKGNLTYWLCGSMKQAHSCA